METTTGSKILYVDMHRSGTYTEDGTFARPYKTIMGAVNKIIANGDNSSYRYVVDVAPGEYPETIVLEDTALADVEFIGRTRVYINPTGGAFSLRSVSGNQGLTAFSFRGIDFANNIGLQGAYNPGQRTSFTSSQGRFVECVLFGDVAAENMHDLEWNECQLVGTYRVQNCSKVIHSGGEGQGSTGHNELVFDAAQPYPNAGLPFTYVIVERTLTYSNYDVGNNCTLQLREGTRALVPPTGIQVQGGTAGGTLQAYSSWIWGGITILASGTFVNRGSFYVPTNLSLDPAASFSNETYSKVVFYDNSISGLVADNVQDAIDELAAQGVQGYQGPVGPQGDVGDTGAQGSVGDTGAQGDIGSQGAVGDIGAQGPVGDTGAQGPVGDTGSQGSVGDTGAQGPVGDTGAQGDVGDTGSQGPEGVGSQGPAGDTGSQGPAGDTGAQGPEGIGTQGPAGDTGSQGPVGSDGNQGPVGAQGPQGPQAPTQQMDVLVDMVYYPSTGQLVKVYKTITFTGSIGAQGTQVVLTAQPCPNPSPSPSPSP